MGSYQIYWSSTVALGHFDATGQTSWKNFLFYFICMLAKHSRYPSHCVYQVSYSLAVQGSSRTPPALKPLFPSSGWWRCRACCPCTSVRESYISSFPNPACRVFPGAVETLQSSFPHSDLELHKDYDSEAHSSLFRFGFPKLQYFTTKFGLEEQKSVRMNYSNKSKYLFD